MPHAAPRHATATRRNTGFCNITDGKIEVRKHNKTLTAPPRERRRRRPIRSLEAHRTEQVVGSVCHSLPLFVAVAPRDTAVIVPAVH